MKGLEISTIALVDGTYNTAYTLSVKQMPPSLEASEENAIDFSVNHITTLKQERITVTLPQHIASDGFYAKRRFVNGALEAGFHVIAKTPISGISMNRQSANKRTGDALVSLETKSIWTQLTCHSSPVTWLMSIYGSLVVSCIVFP